MEREEPVDKDQHEDEVAADVQPEEQDPEQDETDSTTWDTDQHSDAPGPTGTG